MPSTKDEKAVRNTGIEEKVFMPMETSHAFSRLKTIKARKTAKITMNDKLAKYPFSLKDGYFYKKDT